MKAKLSDQGDFLADALRRKGDAPWIFCSHDPSFGPYGRIVKPYLGTLEKALFAHRHVPWTGRLETAQGWAFPFGSDSVLRRKSLMCPSVSPISWRGGGYLCGWIGQNGAELEERRVEYSELLEKQVELLPFATLFGSLKWMHEGHVRRKQIFSQD